MEPETTQQAVDLIFGLRVETFLLVCTTLASLLTGTVTTILAAWRGQQYKTALATANEQLADPIKIKGLLKK